jgi:hypothetical protein
VCDRYEWWDILTSSGADVIVSISTIESIQIRLDDAKSKLLSIALDSKSTFVRPDSLQRETAKGLYESGSRIVVEVA